MQSLTATPGEAAESPPAALDVAVQFDVPGVGDVWLVPSPADAERLGIPRGQWLTPEHLLLLEPLEPAERLEVLQWMRAMRGIILTAPTPRGIPYREWLRQSIDRKAKQAEDDKDSKTCFKQNRLFVE
jgi:hypothetical protein